MATTTTNELTNNDSNIQTRNTQWGTAVTGQLADDFLRFEGSGGSVVNGSQQAIYNGMFGGNQVQGGILNITVVQARLAKNYGMTRMDPYCRLRVGIQVFETPTSYNGSKTPRWNKLVQCHIPDTLREFHVEIFDECSFSVDERIAWGVVKLTDSLFEGDTVEHWHSLCGKQGDDKEGMIHIVLKYQKFEGQPFVNGPAIMQNPMMVVNPMGGAMGAPMVVNAPMYGYGAPYVPGAIVAQQQPTQNNYIVTPAQPQSQQTQQTQPQQPQIDPAAVQTLKEMCPTLDEDIILSVLHQSGGNVDRAAGTLLEMSATG